MTPRHTAKKPARKTTRKVGRPTDYQADYARMAAAACGLGATDADLATLFNVDERTINRWKDAHPAFCQSVKAAKDTLDAQVEHSLFRRAMGWEHDAVRILTVPQGENQGSVVEQIPYVEKYPGSEAAQIFWLKNRKPDRWRDKSEVAVTGDFAAMLEAARKRVAHR